MSGTWQISSVRMIAACVMSVLLLISAVSDFRKRVIPAACSRLLLITALFILVYEKSYWLAAYFIFAVLATGSRILKIPLFAGAVVLLANTGEESAPFIFSLAAADLLFSFGIIGGGDAQLLFSMLAFGYGNLLMPLVITAVTMGAGFICVLHRYGFREAGNRLISAAGTLRSGNIDSDSERLRVPLACVLFVSFLLYLFVSLRK